MSLVPPVATEIRMFRQKLGLSQAKLAEILGLSTRAVEEWEAGRRTAPAMLRFAFAALNEGLEPWGVLPPEGRIVTKA
jgi:transcriptional regulator with XRE-family HTH domain